MFYFGGADGGVWRTDDAGSTWRPLFDREGSASIGAPAIAPSDPSVVWVGTGQIHQRWDIVDGDGVYRSTDGGESWTHLGLEETKHIGALWVDPRSADTAVVAALGHVFGPNEERGLFRTDDGGRTWTRVLYLDPDTGAADLAGTPELPDGLFASLWQVRRHPWLEYSQPTVGPGSGIYKSLDGGRSWAAVPGSGLPEGPLGRIELAVAPGNEARRVWAAVQTADGGGLYRGGDDYHPLWIDPRDPRRMIAGADQGAVVMWNGGESWTSWYNQPTGQFYRLAVDDRFPYHWRTLQLDLPTTGINDLLVHDDDVIVATQGRAIWVLDEVAPLRRLAAGPVAGEPVLVPPGTAWRLRFDQNRDTPLPPEEPRGENPPVGAVLDYILPEGAGGEVTIEVLDSGGALVRRFGSDDVSAPPTAPQREVLSLSEERLRAEARWTAFEDGTLRDLRQRLERAGLGLARTTSP